MIGDIDILSCNIADDAVLGDTCRCAIINHATLQMIHASVLCACVKFLVGAVWSNKHERTYMHMCV